MRVDQGKGNATGRIVVSPNDATGALEEVIVVKGLGAASDSGSTESQSSGTSTGKTDGTQGGDGA